MAFRVETIINGLQGSPYYNRLHYGSDEFDGEIGAEGAADAVRSLWAAIAAVMHNQSVIQVQPEVAQVDDNSGETVAVFITDQAPIAGALSTERLPSSQQILAQHRTGVYVGGREVRGRTFVPGVTESANDSGRPIAATRTTVAAAFNTWFANHNPSGGVLGVNGFTPVTATTVWSEFAFLSTRRS
uniref:Uncharacterized protein n=1 Tax=uncultured prokaryote TaxID=198431 RepID=A0A0H5Q4B7_9ZZZZ|nr:hypothetical protein [uncultured prokaryote]